MNKAFTLIELLAVIVILAIILVIAIPQINKVIQNSKNNVYIDNKKMVSNIAELYVSKHPEIIPTEVGNTVEIKLQDLIDAKLINDIKDPNNKSNIASGYVLVTKLDNGTLDYDVNLNYNNIFTDSLTDGLVAHYKLDGNGLDSSLNNYHAISNTAIPTVNRFGTTNNGVQFAYNKFIDFGDIDFDYSNFTVALWTKNPTNDRLNSSYPIHVTNLMGKGSWNNTATWYIGFKSANVDPAEYLSFVYGINWSAGPSYALNKIDLSKWNYFVGVATPTKQELYVNGNLVSSVNANHANVSNSYSLQIGRSSYFDRNYSGIIDDIKIYSRALSSDEIKQNYILESISD